MSNRKPATARDVTASVMGALMTGNAYDTKKFDGELKWVAATGPKMDCMIHNLAVAAIFFSLPHKDGGHLGHERAAKLVNTLHSLNKSARTKALVAWFHAYSNIRLRLKDGENVWTSAIIGPTSKMYQDADPETARIKPFWSVEEKATDPKAFNDAAFASALSNLLSRAKGKGATLSTKAATALKELEAAVAALPKEDAGKEAVDPLTQS